MNQQSETVIYEKNNVKITNLRAVFSEKTYPISNITSVGSKRIEDGSCLPFSLFIIGVLLLMVGVLKVLDGIYSYLLYSALFLGLGFFLHRSRRPTFAVGITTASGEIKALTSPDEMVIKEIVEALNNAIVQKG